MWLSQLMHGGSAPLSPRLQGFPASHGFEQMCDGVCGITVSHSYVLPASTPISLPVVVPSSHLGILGLCSLDFQLVVPLCFLPVFMV